MAGSPQGCCKIVVQGNLVLHDQVAPLPGMIVVAFYGLFFRRWWEYMLCGAECKTDHTLPKASMQAGR